MKAKDKIRPSEGLRRAYQNLSSAFSGAPLTLPQAALLRCLRLRGPQYQTQLVEATGIDRSTLSEMLKRLATAAFVVCVRIEGNKRAIMISLTPKGRAALQKADGALFMAEASLMRLVPQSDRPAFLRSLQAIVEAQ